MSRFDATTTASVLGLAGFQLIQAWNSNAPSLKDLREASPDDIGVRQKLHDADFMVGGVAIILGVTFSILARDNTALYVMLVIFGSISLWHHSVLNAESR